MTSLSASNICWQFATSLSSIRTPAVINTNIYDQLRLKNDSFYLFIFFFQLYNDISYGLWLFKNNDFMGSETWKTQLSSTQLTPECRKLTTRNKHFDITVSLRCRKCVCDKMIKTYYHYYYSVVPETTFLILFTVDLLLWVIRHRIRLISLQ